MFDMFHENDNTRGALADRRFDSPGTHHAVQVQGTLNYHYDQDQGWTVEIAFPWAVLKECAKDGKAPAPGDAWRVNFSRVEWRVEVKEGRYEKVRDPKTGKPLPEDNWVWSPQGLVNMHYPELWGYVQFSGKKAGTGEEPFRPDPDGAARWALRRVYYAERVHFQRAGAYTESPAILGLDGPAAGEAGGGAPEIRCTWNLFEARIRAPGGGVLHIDQSGRTWRTGP